MRKNIVLALILFAGFLVLTGCDNTAESKAMPQKERCPD